MGATGGTISYYGGDVIHAFTSNGSFYAPAPARVRIFGVGGGGAGGNGDNSAGGGGGAGRVLDYTDYLLPMGTYAVTIGQGVAHGNGWSTHSTSTVFGAILTAVGGGNGRYGAQGSNGGGTLADGASSGGGHGWANYAPGSTDGGYSGGYGADTGSSRYTGGGGGGAASAGSNGTVFEGGVGGLGIYTDILGASAWVGGGGGGGGTNVGAGGGGGQSGGGEGTGSAEGGDATTYGSGGGGSGAGKGGGAGMQGILVVRYALGAFDPKGAAIMAMLI